MTLIRWQARAAPAEMNRIFRRPLRLPDPCNAPLQPADGPRRERDAVRLRADLPGLNAQDVKIEFDHNVLTISGERRSASEELRERLSPASSARPARSPAH